MSKYAETVYKIENCLKCKGNGKIRKYVGMRYTTYPTYMGGPWEPRYEVVSCPACSPLREEISYK